MSSKLADYLQVWGLEDHHIIFSDGSFGMGFSLNPVDASCWSIEQSNEYAQRLIQFLNGLPPEIDFQFISASDLWIDLQALSRKEMKS